MVTGLVYEMALSIIPCLNPQWEIGRPKRGLKFFGVGFKVLSVDNLFSSVNLFFPTHVLNFIHVKGDSKETAGQVGNVSFRYY